MYAPLCGQSSDHSLDKTRYFRCMIDGAMRARKPVSRVEKIRKRDLREQALSGPFLPTPLMKDAVEKAKGGDCNGAHQAMRDQVKLSLRLQSEKPGGRAWRKAKEQVAAH